MTRLEKVFTKYHNLIYMIVYIYDNSSPNHDVNKPLLRRRSVKKAGDIYESIKSPCKNWWCQTYGSTMVACFARTIILMIIHGSNLYNRLDRR